MKRFVPTPAEVYDLAEFSPVERIFQAMAVSDFCIKADQNEPDRRWAYMKEIHAIFLAGYIAGKREERARRKGAVV